MEDTDKANDKGNVAMEFNRLLSYHIRKIEYLLKIRRSSNVLQQILQVLRRKQRRLFEEPPPEMQPLIQSVVMELQEGKKAKATSVPSDLLDELKLFQIRHDLE